MKKLLLGTATAAALAMALASPANAVVSISVNPTVTNYATDLVAVPDSKIIWDFDTIFAPGYSYTPATAIDVGSTPSVSRAPKGDTTVYGTVNPLQSPATFSATAGLTKFSWLVGSPDAFNRVVFKGLGGVVLGDLTGAPLFGPTVPLGGLDIARRIEYSFGGARAYDILFYSNRNAKSFALEFDRFAGTVPEPTTWSMMLIGFFGFGSVLRRARKQSALVNA